MPPVAGASLGLTDARSAGDLRRGLYRLAWPAMLENLLQSATFLINTALVGRLGAEALSAGGISNFLMFFLITPVAGLSAGVLAMVARAAGRGDLAAAQRAARHGLAIAVGLSLLTTVVILVAADGALTLVGADANVIATGAPYLRVASLFAVFQATLIVTGGVVRGTGNARSPMLASLLMTVIDAVVGYLLVFDVVGPGGLGLLGVAIAFSLARVVAAGYLLTVLLRSPLGRGLWRGAWLDLTTFRRLLRVGGPAAIENTITFSGVLASNVIGLHLGTVKFAAQNVIGSISSFAFMPTFGMGLAAATAVGQSLGARRPDLARRYSIEAVLGGTVVAGLLGLVLILIPDRLLGIFTTDAAVIAAGWLPLRVVGFAVILFGPGNVLPGALRGAGDTRAMLTIAIVALWMVRIPVALGLAFGLSLGLVGIWLGLAADYLVRSLAAYLRFASGKWQGIEM